jgi:hypothetical protein
MSVKLEKAYRKELHKALEKCQFIEETLRMCIFSAVEIARLQLSPHFPVKYKTEATRKMKEIVARATDVHNNVLDVRYALVRSLSEVRRSRDKE